jgi:hypothetical protein
MFCRTNKHKNGSIPRDRAVWVLAKATGFRQFGKGFRPPFSKGGAVEGA